ncbi:hypothetical protein GIS00_14665 [Nakamurella sp. YIM 132087]|uniref:Uncharacterized protein n=1 Tax=Nakamurella alba TaxID=2665158 RepID=A0A7K1FPM2_9ACTN|nr:hypothetical protein [Nakamurella alba]MTD15183.1 hypothetical protein [Nakamurella alba]
MFTENNIQDVEITDGAPYVRALVDKLIDLDRNRINKSDELVMRKAVFGLLEIVAELERRLVALEDPIARSEWQGRLETVSTAPTPDQVRLGE